MDFAFSVNTIRLQEFVYRIKEETRIVENLCEQIKNAQAWALPENQWRYEYDLRCAHSLRQYFLKTEDVLSIACEDYELLSKELECLFEEAIQIVE